MGVILQKGANVNLSKIAPTLTKILVGIGWDVRSTTGDEFDLDASLFMVGENGKVYSDADFIFYNQTKSLCGSVEHTGDNRTGEGDGDDESMKVELDKVPDNIHRLVITVTIYNAESRKQNFGMVSGASVRLVNIMDNIEIIRFDLSEDYSTETAMIFGEIYRYKGEWKFKAVGQGYAGGLRELCVQHGVRVN